MARCKKLANKKRNTIVKHKIQRNKPSQPSVNARAGNLSLTSKSEPQLLVPNIEKNENKSLLHNAPLKDGERNCKIPIIPFSSDDRILLIGEADLSFACSLIKFHNCSQVTATVYESKEELRVKYPYVDDNIRLIENSNQAKIRYSFDVKYAKLWSVWLNTNRKSRVSGSFDRIIFNFPHVGGKTKDVNRQVRYNQELLVSFFKHALPCLSSTTSSSIIVTLFEGEPYTLWNIRDLARHSGLVVARSFSFIFSAYPGYKHSRTIGVLKSKSGKESNGWKGENRSARTFIFVRKGEDSSKDLKRKREQDSSDDENDIGE
ncbi:25S rRNA -methyltransferase [Erysiphe neolycopersici]|uniref:25S rRNA-methyltransferase n=1 Tax=Erysiphe neolycopersici TaxID=212602 RepID=A0A420HFJ8_9PEZI|nr:25S rRNA -methyltransferase [Erysiphe neolycopersici]